MNDESDTTNELASNRLDYLTAAFKGALGIIPLGSLVAEAVGATIPRQRIDRMADVVQKLAFRLDEVGAELHDISARFRSPEFTDAFEEAMRQSGRALSEERREYIANLLFRGLTEAEFDNARARKLLALLDDLTDPELIWLTYSGLITPDAQQQFYSMHEVILDDSVGATIGSPAKERDLAALRESYWRRLAALGLTQATRGSALGEITSLGRLLLRYVGAPADFHDTDEEEFSE